jgi:hypothetical protein
LNTANWYLCNQTNSSITTVNSFVINVAAK